MRKKLNESLKFKLLNRIKKSSRRVFLRADFTELGNYNHIGRVLVELIAENKLVRIGFGVYAKAYSSPYVDAPLIKGGGGVALREALTRLKVKWEPGSAEAAYNAGKTTQVPMRNVVRLKSRCRRRLSYGGSPLLYEQNINAK